jgi:hypothetical protein
MEKTWGGKGLRWGKTLGVGKDLEATLAACRPWNERGLKNFAKRATQNYQHLNYQH